MRAYGTKKFCCCLVGASVSLRWFFGICIVLLTALNTSVIFVLGLHSYRSVQFGCLRSEVMLTSLLFLYFGWMWLLLFELSLTLLYYLVYVSPKLNCSILILVCLCNILLFFDFMVLKFLLIKFSVVSFLASYIYVGVPWEFIIDGDAQVLCFWGWLYWDVCV